MVTPWLVGRRPSVAPRARIVAVPFAGAGAAAFAAWRTVVPDDLAFDVVRLPARENRFAEPARTDLREVADEVAGVVSTDLPIVLFGYSLGAYIAYEVAARLGDDAVALLAVGGANAPHVASERPRLSELDDEAFVRALRDLGGTPDEVFANAELLELVLPALRGDFAMLDAYHSTGEPLRCPIVTFSGDDDRELTKTGVQRWGELTSGPTSHHTFAGGHFFLTSAVVPLVTTLVTELEAVLAR